MKKQFRLYDIYRCAAIGERSNIQGIANYECDVTATHITVRFDNGHHFVKSFCSNEQELRELVKDVNKRLNNCARPGPKKGNYKRKHKRY